MKHRFEIVFISWDRDQESFDHYYNEMPWKALSFAGKSICISKTTISLQLIQYVRFLTERTRQEALTNKFQVRGIPCLVVLSPSGEIIVSNATKEINTNGVEYIRQWSRGKYLFEIMQLTILVESDFLFMKNK